MCSSSGAMLPKPRKVSLICTQCYEIRSSEGVVSRAPLNNVVVSVVVCDTGEQTPFGLIRIALIVVPFLYVGTQISKNFAVLLEEHDIFVPEDDDDDD